MADSSYYYDKYLKKKEEVRELEKNIKDLQKVQNSLTNNMYDEIRAINNQLDQLIDDLEKSVRYNAVFSRRCSELLEKKEKSVTADQDLSGCISNLEDEIQELTRKKQAAEDARDNYYQRYKEEKAEERRERSEARKNLLS